eukprot:CAMPEP_0114487302 /NCGR_PEP_ID=MMETSP0109-20121206/693_1 /TAXON_ID=29199 /ORGANISM="Chlorarachnion reptans, Strain CCCM449" /LENGTH=32 /DNA_ID= /DNA_START= /DNA_END= /DNA_ORIENTATION=
MTECTDQSDSHVQTCRSDTSDSDQSDQICAKG